MIDKYNTEIEMRKRWSVVTTKKVALRYLAGELGVRGMIAFKDRCIRPANDGTKNVVITPPFSPQPRTKKDANEFAMRVLAFATNVSARMKSPYLPAFPRVEAL